MAKLDKRGLLTDWTDRRSKLTTFTYDAARRRTERQDALGNKAAWTYDKNSNAIPYLVQFGGLSAPVRLRHLSVLAANATSSPSGADG